jgi:RNA polymerase subunit RPABC4/transcription elongation factor Spt4
MPFDPSVLSNLMLVLTGFGAAFAVSLWISLIIWTSRDIRSRTRDPLVRILAVFLSTVLFLPGILIYLILRPARTLQDDYERALEEESLLAAIEDAALCPGCSRRIQADWVICPSCHTRLKKACVECGKPIDLAWDLCPFCGAPTEAAQIEDASPLEPLPEMEETPITEMEAAPLPEESTPLAGDDEGPELSNPL